MDKFNVDVPVALIFFNRDDTLKLVFEQIRCAKPSKLFLIQDGARANSTKDAIGIAKCREIVENVDWECQVYKNYAEQNMGCGCRVSSGISWVFEHVDKVVIIEDDCVVEPSFLQFSKEMLERYEHDDRVCMVSALNHFVEWDCGDSDYFFAKTGAIAAWATWKRVWDKFDFLIEDFGNPYNQKVVEQSFRHRRAAKSRLDNWSKIYAEGQKEGKVRYWGPQFGYLKYKTTALAIVPKHTLSCNIGVGESATFSGAGLKFMKKEMRSWFFQKTYPMDFPLKHPDCILPDEQYDKKYYDITYPNKVKAFFQRAYYYVKRKLCRK